MNDNLYIIIPYFNFYDVRERFLNLVIFLKSFELYANNFSKCKIIIVEGIYEDSIGNTLYSDLLKTQDNKFKNFLNNKNCIYIKYTIPQKIWVKENLINLVIKDHLPKNWEYFCWLDGDILFDNDNWINDSIRLLKEFDVIQTFSHTLGTFRYSLPRFEFSSQKAPMRSEDQVCKSGSYSFIRRYKDVNNKFISLITGSGHPGYGWGMNRSFYNKIGKLWDSNIVGGGDRLMSNCIVQVLEEKKNNETYSYSGAELLNRIYSKKYAQEILNYYSKFKNCKYSYLNSGILHMYHSNPINRKYRERHEILKKFNYDPTFLKYNRDGIIYLEKNSELQQEIEEYLTQREN
jgi:hypothetical protein